MGMIISIIAHLVTGNYMRVEQAVRCGILQMLLALNPSKGDLPNSVLIPCYSLLTNLPRYFLYYSVVSSFAEANSTFEQWARNSGCKHKWQRESARAYLAPHEVTTCLNSTLGGGWPTPTSGRASNTVAMWVLITLHLCSVTGTNVARAKTVC